MTTTATRRLVMQKAWPLSLTAILAAGLLLTLFATYRHAKTFSRLPPISLKPEQLILPLSPRDLAVRRTRWVELKATPTVVAPGEKSVYRNTVESPNSLLLRFNRSPGVTQQKYRGVLVPLLNRTRPGATPDPFMKEIFDSGIAPTARYAILLVGESPWQVWLPRIKAIAAITSGVVIALFLLLQWLRAIGSLRGTAKSAEGGVPSRSTERAIVGAAWAIAFIAIGWMYYQSLHARPILPVGTLVAFGISAALGLMVRRNRSLVF